jgi:transitional endoplasmic reticulum ATPase
MNSHDARLFEAIRRILEITEKRPMPTKKKKEDDLTIDDFPDAQLERRGQHIIVPETMPLPIAAAWINRRIEQEESFINFNEPIDAYPLEGAHAFAQALAKIYGFTALVPTAGFWMDRPPTMVKVEIDVNKTVDVPWGTMVVPEIEGRLETSVVRKYGRPVFAISGTVRQKHLARVMAIVDETRIFVSEQSIYKGKALRMKFPDYSSRDFDPSTDMPRFIDVRSIDPASLIFGKEVQDQIDVSLFTPIRKTEMCKKLGIPLKRGILLHGVWGVGKTLTAHVAARLCVDNGWMFLYLEQVDQLSRAIEFGRPYGDVLIFGEDFDRIAERRNDILNVLLNTIDGLDSKTSNIMVVLTTNRLDVIDASALRPGRLDAVIEVTAPDADAANRLVRRYAGNLLAEDTDLTEVGKTLDGMIPAVIREVVERSKLGAIHRLKDGDMLSLMPEDLLIAAKGMAAHLALLEPEEDDDRSEMEKAAEILGDKIGEAVANLSSTNGEQFERDKAQVKG